MLVLQTSNGTIVDPNGKLVCRIVYAERSLMRDLRSAAEAWWLHEHRSELAEGVAALFRIVGLV